MLVELVQTSTKDGVRLDGAFRAGADVRPVLEVDGFCLVHGTGSNFYSTGLLQSFSDALHEQGVGVLRVNTRGHDSMSTAATTRGGQRQGAAYELVDDCRYDLRAWLDWLRERTGPRIVLIGHSLGAVKALYALAHEPGLNVQAIVALSPPRLSYSWFCSNPEADRFLEFFRQAEAKMDAGEPTALIEVKLPLSMVITAAGYVEKYGPDERYNYLKFLRSVQTPVLVTLGDLEIDANAAFRGAAEAVEEIRAKKADLAVETIADADHFYTNARKEVVARVLAWLTTST